MRSVHRGEAFTLSERQHFIHGQCRFHMSSTRSQAALGKDCGPIFPLDPTLGADINYIQMRLLAIVFPLCLFLMGCPQVISVTVTAGGTPQQQFEQAIDKLAKAKTEEERFYALDAAAKQSFEVGKIEDARKYAEELQTLLPKYKGDWNYGNAIQDANLVMGRIALREGRTEDAKKYLIAAGKSPGSPQLNSFGPNMTLAKDLLEKSERETVLEYFELCRKFWKMDYGKLNEWRDDVKAERIPEFGPNLLY